MDQGLDAEAVGDVITRLAERAGLDIRPTGHSPRRGLVTESKVMRRCCEDDDGFTENALHGVL
ncbi:hypothetical protein OHT93_37705 [Streptomyces sp. NBC_00191]|uniref:hypothetical protein n=1 Tax=Streptomyces sp. NBC_00191 TaxID=2975674 RepID=UPI0032559486